MHWIERVLMGALGAFSFCLPLYVETPGGKAFTYDHDFMDGNACCSLLSIRSSNYDRPV